MLRLVLNNRRIKVAELASECGISNGSVYTIIHEHLGMSKLSARWVPRNLNMQDSQQRVESSQDCIFDMFETASRGKKAKIYAPHPQPQPKSFYRQFQCCSSVAVLCSCDGGCICDFCFGCVCSPYVLLLVPRKGCSS